MATLSRTRPRSRDKSSAPRKGPKRKAPGGGKRTRAELKRVIVEAFRKEFPTDTVDVSDGYEDNLHVMVVSRKFDRMSERQKRDMMWGLVESAGLSQPEKDLISLLIPWSPAEIK